MAPKSWTKNKKILYAQNDNPEVSPRRHHEHRRSLGEDAAKNGSEQSQHTSSTHTCPNTTIIGHYELKKTLGKGNFSTVKLAQHRITNHSVAIKVVKISVLSDDNLMKVNREIDVLKKLGKHDHIVRLYQVIKMRKYFMLVTEYCANGELYDYLVNKGKLSEPQSCDFFLQILSAIEYLHDHSVVHRDLKAENLLLTDNFKTIKIADFGFANYFKRDKLLSTWCGSPPYAAPELFKGIKYVGPPVDIWSMGVILYVLVCGSLPFDGNNLVYLKSRVLSGKFRIPFFMSTECEGLIKGMLRLDPERRYSIRQIRAHCWIQKYGQKIDQGTSSNGTTINLSNSQIFRSSIRNKNSPPSLRDTIDNKPNSIGTSDDTSDINNNSTNRGQSLDLEDDQKKQVDGMSDASMLCLTNDSGKSIQRISNGMAAQAKLSRIHNFVNTDMANAVSNMSIDSNNSSMSVSQGNDTSNTYSTYSTDRSTSASGRPNGSKSDTSAGRDLNKQNSIDNQIIEFMIGTLKVANNQDVIKRSITRDKYDDLHAIYRLIRDQPEILNSNATFKVPSLPLINPNRSDKSSRPSITTGFFKSSEKRNETVSSRPSCNDATDNFVQSVRASTLGDIESNPSVRAQAINLVTHQESTPAEDEINHLVFEHRKSQDHNWKPPQLFLTPPVENKANQQISGVEAKTDAAKACLPSETKTPARHSFDSTMQQIACLQNSNNGTNNQRNSSWDSSILDSLGASGSITGTDSSPISPKLSGQLSGCLEMDDTNKNLPGLANMAGITTNLLQIGARDDAVTNKNQNLILAQINAPTAGALAFTQSGLLPQLGTQTDQRFQANVPVGFTPNNLVNQNFAALNGLSMQKTMNSPGTLNLNLLDPSGLISGLERRASDGQASYNSLTCTTDSNQQTATGQKYQNTSENPSPASNSVLSTSSFQLSNQLSYQTRSSDQSSQNQQYAQATRYSFTDQTLRPDCPSSSNNSMLFSSDDQSHDLSRDFSNNSNSHQTQQNPLDLSRGSKDTMNNDQVFSATNACGFDRRLFEDHLSHVSNQRSNSTTSASSIFNNNNARNSPISTTTSPRNSSLMSSTASNNNNPPLCQISPSSLSLTGGGLGHLSARRKRHSLETESRHYHCQHFQQNHHQNGHPPPKCRHIFNAPPHDMAPRGQHRANHHNLFFKYPIHSPLGQLRNFAQTFSYKNLVKRPNTSSPPTSLTAQQSPIAMDVNNDQPLNCDRNPRVGCDPFGDSQR